MKNVDCIILAGGNSKRMKFPKELIKINNEYLIHSTINELKKVFDEIIVVSNRSQHYEGLNVNVVRDIFYKKGPMAGLHSGLVYSKSDFSFLLACDMPNIDIDFILFLISQIDDDFDGVVCRDENNEIMPMYAIYKRDLKDCLRDELLKDNRKIIKFIEDNNFKFLNFDDWKYYSKKNIFENLNTIDELKNYNPKK